MNILLLQFFLLLLLAGGVGWLVGGRLQRIAARQRESGVGGKLKISERNLRELTSADGEGSAGESKIFSAQAAARQESELRLELARQKVDAERWEASYREIQAQKTELTAAKWQLDSQIEGYQEQESAELAVADEKLTEAQAELAEQQDVLAEAQAEAQRWQGAYRELEGAREELVSARADLGQSQDDRNANEEKLQLLQTELQQAGLAASENERRIQELIGTQASAVRKVQRMRKLYLNLRAQFDAVKQQNLEVKEQRMAAQSQVEKLTVEVARSKEIAKTLHSEFMKRRSYVAQLRKNLERTQTSLTESQRQADKVDNERKQVDEVNESLRQTLAAQQQQTRSAPLADMQAPLEAPLQESSSAPETVSKSPDRRVKALETIVRNQRAKLDLLDDVVGDMQALLSSDKSQAVRSRRQLPTRRAGVSNASDDLQLIKGIGWRKAARLRNLGIDSFGDIARLNEKDVLWLDQVLGLEGTILRQDWVGQSRVLSISEARRDKLARQTKGMNDAKSAPAKIPGQQQAR